MWKTLIVDDERLARIGLRKLLEPYDQIGNIREAGNADEAAELVEDEFPDVVFLDIQMPEKTGFDLLEMLPQAPNVIFTTAYDEYAIRAFETNALDYLLKPIEPKRLEEALEKLQNKLHPQQKSEQRQRDNLSEHDQVFVKDGEKCWFVALADVSLFESEGNYVKVYFGNNRPLIHRSLNSLDERLDDRVFFRASRKHIINLKWIEKIETWFNGGLMVVLRDGNKIEISRRQAAKFRERMSL